MYKKNSQISIEYMLIIGFATVISIPLVIIYFDFSQDSSDEISSAQIQQLGKKIVDAAESVYYLGEPSQTTLRVNIPDSVVLSNLSAGYELVYKIRTKTGNVDIVTNSPINITGSLPSSPGTYTITIKAVSDYVDLSYK